MAKDVYTDRYSAIFRPQTVTPQSTYVSPYRFSGMQGTPTEDPANLGENPEYVRPSFLERVEEQIQVGPFKTLAQKTLPPSVYGPLEGTLNMLDTPARTTHGALRGAWDAASVAARAAESGDPLLSGLAVARGVGTLAMGGLAGLTPAGNVLIGGTEELGKHIPAVKRANQFVMAPVSTALFGDMESKEAVSKWQALDPKLREAIGLGDVATGAAMFGGLHNGITLLNKKVGLPARYAGQYVGRQISRDVAQAGQFIKERLTPLPKESLGVDPSKLPPRIRDYYVNEFLQQKGPETPEGKVSSGGNRYSYREIENAIVEDLDGPYLRLWNDQMVRGRNGESMMDFLMRAQETKELQDLAPKNIKEIGFWSDSGYSLTAQEVRKKADTIFQAMTSEKPRDGFKSERDRVYWEAAQAFRKYTPLQIDNNMAILDARAKVWGEMNGKSPDEYFKNLEVRRAGVAAEEGALTQGALAQQDLTKSEPAFYSVLKQNIEQKMPERANALQVRNIMKQYATKDEAKWTGLDDFLEANKDRPITKREVLDYLDQNGVRIEEKWYPTPGRQQRGQLPINLADIGAITDPTSMRMWANELIGSTDEQFQEVGIALNEGLKSNQIIAAIPNLHGEDLHGWVYRDNEGKYAITDHSDRFNTANEAKEFAINLYNAVHTAGGADPAYFQYSTAGGENYREVLFTLPETSPAGQKMGKPYEASHWRDKNVLAHARMADFTTRDGKKVLYIEEIQSDLHQLGRDIGYAPSPKEHAERTKAAKEGRQEINSKLAKLFDGSTTPLKNMRVRYLGGNEVQTIVSVTPRATTTNDKVLYMVLRDNKGETSTHQVDYQLFSPVTPERFISPFEVSTDGGKTFRALSDLTGVTGEDFRKANYTEGYQPPQAPFSKTWHELTMRRLMQQAAREGYDYVAWTPGEHQALRWSGAEEAGTGMPEFYDNMLVKYGDHLAKKFGSNVMKLELPSIETSSLVSPKEAEQAYKSGKDVFISTSGEDWQNLRDIDYMNEEMTLRKSDGTEVKVENINQFFDALRDVSVGRMNDHYEIALVTQNEPGATHIRRETLPNVSRTADLNELWGSEAGDYVYRNPTEARTVHAIPITEKMKEPTRLFQKPGERVKGTFNVEDGRRIITAFQAADISTMVHEVGHVFRRDLSGGLLKQAESWAGVKEGKWDVEAEEKFANGFTEYLRTGRAPTGSPYGLRKVFENFKRWLTELYSAVSQRDPAMVSDEIREVFDALLVGPRGVIEGMNYEGWGPNRAEGPITHKGVPALGEKTPYLYTDIRTGGTYAMPQEDITRSALIEQLRKKRKDFGVSVLRGPGMQE